MSGYPRIRLRRLRRTPGLRRLVAAPWPAPQQLIWPVFVRDGRGVREPIADLPGQQRFSPDTVAAGVAEAVSQGVGGLLVFGLPDPAAKDAVGEAAVREDGVAPRAVRALRAAYGDELVIATDVCLCAFTDHGHCGPLATDGTVDNDAACVQLGRVASAHAAAGADLVAPSAMMDGQVAAIRAALDAAGQAETAILSYSTKFASAMYGPFREAGGSSPTTGDRAAYQADYRDRRAALRESLLDLEEGADLLMVKPALAYLDLIAALRARTDLPITAYNVSGEYSMVQAAHARGWVDRDAVVREILAAMARAGADLIITYWAHRYEEIFADV